MPAVIDLFGLGPGCVDFRAALLASHGFLAYALPKYGYRDMPRSFAQFAGLVPDKTAAAAAGPRPPPGIDLAFFEEAARWLQLHPRALEGAGVGVLGSAAGFQTASVTAVSQISQPTRPPCGPKAHSLAPEPVRPTYWPRSPLFQSRPSLPEVPPLRPPVRPLGHGWGRAGWPPTCPPRSSVLS